jgi:hypothetical protein
MLVDTDGHDTDGQRVGRFETSQFLWGVGATVESDEARWRIVEILPEVSTAVVYHGVWVVAPA